MSQARDGDGEAFQALVAARLMRTFRLTRAILGTTEEAEDATQDAFLSAWRALPMLRDASRFDAWFGRIVVNACRMHVRRRGRLSVLSVDAMSERSQVRATDDSVEHYADADALQRAINRLSVQHRAVLALRHVESRSVSEVSAILGVPVGTAKWRLHRARAALERAMAEEL